jgi:cell division protein FtsA
MSTALQFGLTPKTKPLSPKRSAMIAALDVGTSKVACLIARLRPYPAQDALRRRTHSIEVMGFGHTLARGMKAGAVIDLVEAEQALRQALDLAERDAKLQLKSVVVSLSAGKPSSELMAATVNVAGKTVSDGDITRVLSAGSQHSVRPGRAVLHSLPIGYSLDEVTGIRDPRGMVGRRFGIDMHAMTADIAVVRNLILAIERCHLEVGALVASPYAAALSVLADDEADLGAALVDLGAGTTTIAVFAGGRFVHGDGFAVGGHHVTMDIARGLNTRIAESERIKTLYGSVLAGGSDDRDMIARPRVEEILEMVRDRLKASPFAAEPRGRVILTGGACQLNGLVDLATQILGRPVRVGRPLGIAGLPEEAKGPAFAAAAGLLVYPQAAHLEHFEPHRMQYAATGTGGYMARVGRWLRESF